MSKVKELVKILNENMVKLNKEDQDIFTDIILNIRYASISENDAEEFLQQILDATLQAEKEGKNIKDVLGTDDIEKYCREIIKEYKNRYPLWKQILNNISIALIVLLIFTGFWELFLGFITNSISQKSLIFNVNITASTIFSYILVCCSIFFITKIVIKKVPYIIDNKIKGFIILFIINILIILTFVVIQLLLKRYILFTINIIYFAIIVPILYIIVRKLSK